MSSECTILALAAVVGLLAASRGEAGERPGAGIPARPKYLALDSRTLAETEGLKLTVGKVAKHPANPLFAEDKPWEPRFDNLYPNVLYDRQAKLYKCWYSPFIIDRPTTTTPRENRKSVTYMQVARKLRREGPWRQMGVCYAESTDGLLWRKPLMDIHRFHGQPSNIVAVGPHGAGVFRDLREQDPARRYKMFFRGQGMSVAFSHDGLHWGEAVRCPQIQARGDTHNNALWAPELGKYVGFTRLWDGQRIVGRTESRDFVHWTKATEVLRGNRAQQTYAMTVFRHAGVYLGLLMILRTREDRTHCELAWSPDTVHWHRIDPGTPLIPNSSEKGDYDWGCVYAAACPVVLRNEVRLYYGASNDHHTNWRDGFLALATLRPDGFAGYEPEQPRQPGYLTTRPVACAGRRLRVSAQAKGGSLRVALLGVPNRGLDDCVPIADDATDTAIQWRDGQDLSAVRGSRVRLRFELRSARLYSFSFLD